MRAGRIFTLFLVCWFCIAWAVESSLAWAAPSKKWNQSTVSAKKNSAKIKKASLKKAQAKKQNRKPKITLRKKSTTPQNELPLRSAQALVMQENGQVLYEKNAQQVQPIASITKLMTAMVVLDAGLDMDELIEITEDDVDRLKNSRSRLKVGTQLTRATALLLALMSSENRAASALGRNYPGGLKAFVKEMNKKSLQLGMNRTYFAEPTGLSQENVSNAFDLSKMVLAASKYPAIRYFSTMGAVDVILGKKIQTFHNTNALIDSQSWQIGISKTGYISEAGRCLVMQAVVANRPVVIVLLDSSGKRSREGDANRIKTWIENKAQITALNTHSAPIPR